MKRKRNTIWLLSSLSFGRSVSFCVFVQNREENPIGLWPVVITSVCVCAHVQIHCNNSVDALDFNFIVCNFSGWVTATPHAQFNSTEWVLESVLLRLEGKFDVCVATTLCWLKPESSDCGHDCDHLSCKKKRKQTKRANKFSSVQESSLARQLQIGVKSETNYDATQSSDLKQF